MPREGRAHWHSRGQAHGSPGPSTLSRGKDVARACNTCRARKGKCDGNGIDSCSWCIEKKQDCSYNPDDRKKTPWNKQARESHLELVNGLTSSNEAIAQEIEQLHGYLRELGIEPPEFNREGDGEMLSGSDEQSNHGHGFGIGISAATESPPETTHPFPHLLGEPALRIPISNPDLSASHSASASASAALSATSAVGSRAAAASASPTSSASISKCNPHSKRLRRSTSASVGRSDLDTHAQTQNENVDYRTAVHADESYWRRHLPEDAILTADEHEKICQLYFKFLCSWVYRHVPQLYWRDMYLSMKHGTKDHPIRTPHWSPFLQNCVLALALPISDKPEVRCLQNREKFASKAIKEMENEFDDPSISSLLGFSTLTCYYSGKGEHGMAFTFFGFSVRMCKLLRLDIDPRKRVLGNVSDEEILTRSWAFWTTFTADVWLSVYMGREFSMDLARCSIPLPTVDMLPADDQPWTLPGVDDTERPNLFRETFVHFCRLTTIAIKLINMVYGMDRDGKRRLDQTVVQKVDTELNDWHSSLPESIASTAFALPHTLMMHISFWYCIILLHQPSYRANPNTKSKSRKLCLRAARFITDIIQQWRDLYTLRQIPVVLLSYVFTSGTTWLIAVSERSHKRATSDQYFSNAEQCLEMLREMSPLWESAKLLAVMFDRLLEEEREKRRREEERWLINEVVPEASGTGGSSGSKGKAKWESPSEDQTRLSSPSRGSVSGRGGRGGRGAGHPFSTARVPAGNDPMIGGSSSHSSSSPEGTAVHQRSSYQRYGHPSSQQHVSHPHHTGHGHPMQRPHPLPPGHPHPHPIPYSTSEHYYPGGHPPTSPITPIAGTHGLTDLPPHWTPTHTYGTDNLPPILHPAHVQMGSPLLPTMHTHRGSSAHVPTHHSPIVSMPTLNFAYSPRQHPVSVTGPGPQATHPASSTASVPSPVSILPPVLAASGLGTATATPMDTDADPEPQIPAMLILDDNDAINGLKRTGMWLNPPQSPSKE